MLGVVVCCLVVWSGVRVVLSLLVWCLVNSIVVVYAFGWCGLYLLLVGCSRLGLGCYWLCLLISRLLPFVCLVWVVGCYFLRDICVVACLVAVFDVELFVGLVFVSVGGGLCWVLGLITF